MLLKILISLNILISILGIYCNNEFMNSCLKDTRSSDFSHYHLIGINSFKIGQTLLYINSILTIILSNNIELMITIKIFTLIWFTFSNNILQLLKDIIGDYNCSKSNKPNGISGHYNFLVFNIITLFYSINYANWTKNKKFYKHYGLLLTNIINLLLFIIIGTETFINGYHSLIQIIYGCLYGLISFQLWKMITSKFICNNNIFYLFIPLLIQWSCHILLYIIISFKS